MHFVIALSAWISNGQHNSSPNCSLNNVHRIHTSGVPLVCSGTHDNGFRNTGYFAVFYQEDFPTFTAHNLNILLKVFLFCFVFPQIKSKFCDGVSGTWISKCEYHKGEKHQRSIFSVKVTEVERAVIRTFLLSIPGSTLTRKATLGLSAYIVRRRYCYNAEFLRVSVQILGG